MSGPDLYAILGVGRTASPEEIKKAYRRLAQKCHPDRNPGNKKAEERFKEISVANDILGDPRKRALYDEFGMEGLQPGFDPRQARAFRARAWGAGGDPFSRQGAGRPQAGADKSFSDILNEMFGNLGRRARGVPGADLEYQTDIDLLDAIRGRSVVITVERPGPCPRCGGTGEAAGRACGRCRGQGTVSERVRLTVKIPAGVDTGSRVRLAGKGEPGQFGGPPGDLYLVITVNAHQFLERSGSDLYLDLPITVGEAVHGATVAVPTPSGTVKLRIPPGSQSGQRLRLRGQGVRNPKAQTRGDLFARLLVQVPRNGTDRVKEAVDVLEKAYAGDPRRHLRL
jgi:molecular chaperone DnaJ